MKKALAAVVTALITLCARGAINPSGSDMFDVSNGVNISAASGYYSGGAGTSSGYDMFGANLSTAETGNTIFADGQSSGFVHYVEFSTASPIRLEQIRLFA